MSKISQITGGRSFPYNLRELLSFRNWRNEFKYDRQRKQRGWSDRDTWDGGNYLLEVMSGVLKKLDDDKSHIDWPLYFKQNYHDNHGYENLKEVAADIDEYLAYDRSSWTDTLEFEITHETIHLPSGDIEWRQSNTDEEKLLIKKAIERSHKKWQRKFNKAKKAIHFIADNHPGLWD